VKITVTLALDIDPEAWDRQYVTGADSTAIRDHVRRYVLQQVQHSVAAENEWIKSARLA
jgi:hypothetical protein